MLGFPDPNFTKTAVTPQVLRGGNKLCHQPLTMQEMTVVDNSSPLYNPQTVVFVFSP